MILSHWKGQIACVFELSIEQERLSGVCRPQLFRGVFLRREGEAGASVPWAFRRSEMNFELAAAGEKEHEWGA